MKAKFRAVILVSFLLLARLAQAQDFSTTLLAACEEGRDLTTAEKEKAKTELAPEDLPRLLRFYKDQSARAKTQRLGPSLNIPEGKKPENSCDPSDGIKFSKSYRFDSTPDEKVTTEVEHFQIEDRLFMTGTVHTTYISNRKVVEKVHQDLLGHLEKDKPSILVLEDVPKSMGINPCTPILSALAPAGPKNERRAAILYALDHGIPFIGTEPDPDVYLKVLRDPALRSQMSYRYPEITEQDWKEYEAFQESASSIQLSVRRLAADLSITPPVTFDKIQNLPRLKAAPKENLKRILTSYERLMMKYEKKSIFQEDMSTIFGRWSNSVLSDPAQGGLLSIFSFNVEVRDAFFRAHLICLSRTFPRVEAVMGKAHLVNESLLRSEPKAGSFQAKWCETRTEKPDIEALPKAQEPDSLMGLKPAK